MFSGINTFSILQIVGLVGAQVSFETCFISGDKTNSAYLSCGEGSVISNVSVQSGTGPCLSKYGTCLGMSPLLLVNQFNCYWKNQCVISWPEEPIIYTESSMTNKECIGKLPEFMIVRYTCYQPTIGIHAHAVERPKRQIIDVCGNTTAKYSIHSEVGIIRSHNLYPWDYSNRPRLCKVSFYPKTKPSILHVTVQNIDLSEGDNLEIKHTKSENNAEEKRTGVDRSGNFVFSNLLSASFHFTVGSESNSGNGFLLCYRFSSSTDRSGDNVCESIMTRGQVSNTEAVNDDPLAFMFQIRTKSTAPSIPPKCLKKKSEKRRQKCIKRFNKKNNTKTKGRSGRKGRGRKRRHSGRRTKP